MAEYTTKLDLAEEILMRLIASGEIAPGDHLRQNDLAERLGVSSTPVREALRRLEAQGLLVRDPHRGVRVAEVEPEEMAELYLIRAALEGLAVEHAAPRIDAKRLETLAAIQDKIDASRTKGALKPLRKLNYDFHTGIYHASELNRLIRLIDSLWPLFPWDSMWTIPGRADSSALEHRAVLDAVRKGNARGAGQAMRRHIESGARALLSYRKATVPTTRRRVKATRRTRGTGGRG